MSEPFLGEIRAFGFNFAPRGWVQCNGQILPINQNQALFSLLGTTFGGNGTQTFALPDLRGRLAISAGTAPSGTTRVLGQVLGEELHTLASTEMPLHQHAIAAAANGTANATNVPSASVIPGSGSSSGSGTPAVPIYAGGTPSTPMLPLGAAGSSQAHENRMPFLVANYCIALQGIFPSRN
jgi:microcystin-dependent protein